MNNIIVLDTGPLSMISNAKVTNANRDIKNWIKWQLAENVIVALPEIADYELRRELLLYGRKASISTLDTFGNIFEFLPFTRETTLKAAALWADVRQRGLPTADPAALNGDVLLAAQALGAPDFLKVPDAEVIVVTDNINHLSRFVKAKSWRELS